MERGADFRVAVAVLAVVLAIAAGIVAIRVHAAGGLGAALEDDRGLSVFRDWWRGDDRYGYAAEDCIDYAERLVEGPNPYEDEISSTGENFSETVGGNERGWSLNISKYSDERAAARALEGLHLLDEAGEACFPDEITVVTFPGAVNDGYGSGYIDRFEGEWEQSFSAVWRRGDELAGIDFWNSSRDDVSLWVRAEYERIRARVDVAP